MSAKLKEPKVPLTPDQEKLAKSLAYLNKRFGQGIVMALDGVVEDKPAISSGHPFIDWVMGGGAFFGKHIELFGQESGGKSTLAYTFAVMCQKMKYNTGRVLLVDVENSFSKTYFKSLGGLVDEDHILVTQPDTAQDAMEIIREFVDNELVDLIIVDSVSALLPKDEEAIFVDQSGKEVDSGKGNQKGQMGTGKIGSQALMMSQSLKQLSPRINNSKVCVIWINQLRTKINTNGPTSETTSGGHALRFYATVRLELRKIGAVKGKVFNPFENKMKDGIIAMRTVVKGAKNKAAPPFREVPITIRFGTGIDVEDAIAEYACNQGMMEKSAQGWYMTTKLGASRNARGLEDFRALMKAEPLIWKGIVDKVRSSNLDEAMDAQSSMALLAEHNAMPEGLETATPATASTDDLLGGEGGEAAEAQPDQGGDQSGAVTAPSEQVSPGVGGSSAASVVSSL